MPVIRSAKKKLKVDKKREFENKKLKTMVDMAVKKAEKKPTQTSLQEAFRIIDKGVKKKIIHKNKGARIKSRLSKLVSKKPVSGPEKKQNSSTKTKKTKKVTK
ncbi:MAG: 30S ribosomal protein S20 [Candidatus Levybacteria bacterium]|nr:30S ribosomal protein S20 [Candidatus Levybacteria bacterium]